MAEPTSADASDAPQVSEPKSNKLLIIIVVALLTSVLAGGGAYWFATKGDHEATAEETDGKGKSKSKSKVEKPKAPAIYVEFDPPFVVNFESRGMTRFLQVSLQVLTRDPITADMIKQHDPVIRNDLLLLFGNQTYETISTREGKDQLRAAALEAIAKIIQSEGGDGKNVEQLYFTSFVMQ